MNRFWLTLLLILFTNILFAHEGNSLHYHSNELVSWFFVALFFLFSMSIFKKRSRNNDEI
tara:strand:+ start:9748 stop:9927 length:180 start_codon:yes stop_codon:yes gene_type:complete